MSAPYGNIRSMLPDKLYKDFTVAEIVEHLCVFDPKGRVYVLLAPALNAVKIGVSTQPRKRIAAWQATIPTKLEFVGTLWGGFRLESILHARYKHFELGMGGQEWFSDQALPEILEIIALFNEKRTKVKEEANSQSKTTPMHLKTFWGIRHP